MRQHEKETVDVSLGCLYMPTKNKTRPLFLFFIFSLVVHTHMYVFVQQYFIYRMNVLHR